MERPLGHIACIDDDEDIARVAELILEANGFKMTIFGSGPEALAGLADIAPDLVLLDVVMPKMDGPATLAAMKKRDDLKHLPVVFMTAKVQPAERSQYAAMGAVGVLAKPFDPGTLAQEVESLWRTLPG
jgi:two-component system, OmpR family, response regulator